MMESEAILFIAEKDRKIPAERSAQARRHVAVVVLQAAHIGPMFGQANHFNRQAR
jgi:GST-like protein